MAGRQQQEMFDGSGTIEAISRVRNSFKIGEDWFSVFESEQLGDAQVGDEVEFKYSENRKGGRTFLNVQGDVTVTEAGDGKRDSRPASRNSGRSAAPSRQSARPAARQSARKDDEPNRQRTIVRQNSLTQANALFQSLVRLGVVGEADDHMSLVLEMAREFEKYSMVEDTDE